MTSAKRAEAARSDQRGKRGLLSVAPRARAAQADPRKTPSSLKPSVAAIDRRVH
jgi:hypothetical protein